MLSRPDQNQCSKCGVAAEFGYRVQGQMEWFCAEHRLSQNYADERVPKAAEPAPVPPDKAYCAFIDNSQNEHDLAKHARAIRHLGKRVIADVIEIGRHLTEAKELCAHGHWLPWLEREFGWKEVTAWNFMNVYKLSLKSSNFEDLSIPVSGLYLLAAPSTPKEAVDKVVERAESGEPVTTAQVKDTIAKAKNPSRQWRNNHRAMKLGSETLEKLRGTSLDKADELDELIVLNRGMPQGELCETVKTLIADAVAGKTVSALAKSPVSKSLSDIERKKLAAGLTHARGMSLAGRNSVPDQEQIRAISSIHVRQRNRRDLGNIDGLAQSIEDIGLLNPITVDERGHLLAGARRLAACKRLKWETIPVNIVRCGDV